MKISYRNEYKYIISYKDYIHLQPLVASLLNHDKHGEENAYPVHSIYFDDLLDHGAADKAFGHEWHKKYRIRHYHDPFKRQLELKEKRGEATKKYSISLTTELYQGLIEQDRDILEQHFDEPLIRKFTLDHLRFHLTPRCDVVYKREAYNDKNNTVRITFDHSLRNMPFDTENDGVFIDLMRGGDMILEIKYDHHLPKYIRTMIKPFNLNQIALSKYYLAYQQLQP